MVWFKVDDKLHDHRKARTARKSAMGVWVLAGSWCMDNLTDGFVPESVLPRWGTQRDAVALVQANLWELGDHNGEPGWWFHDWPEFQPLKSKIQEDRHTKSAAGAKGGKASGRSRREANGQAHASGGASRLVEAQSNPRTRPEPEPVVVVKSVSHLQSVSTAGIDDDGLDQIRQLTKGGRAHARAVAEKVLASATDEVSKPLAYVLRSVRNSPAEYRYRRGNPKRGEECSKHPGEWGDACRSCIIDSKVGDA